MHNLLYTAASFPEKSLGQYRIIGQERFASKFCVLTRRGFEAILSYCKKSQQSQGTKFPQSAAALIVRCCPKLKEYLNPLVIIACTIFVGTTLLSVYAYKGIPLFKGPVLEATSYIYITIFGVCIFKEKLNPKKIVALLLIVGGILVYSLLG